MPSFFDLFLFLFCLVAWPISCNAFVFSTSSLRNNPTQLEMGLFDGFRGGAGPRPANDPAKNKLDEEWEKQQEVLRARRAPKQDRDKYFADVEKRRVDATVKQNDMWAWQTKNYKKGEDPIDEWKKRRANGQISDLENQYGDPKEIGGIPIPGASFGVGGEFGVGGKFDNGGRFDLRLPYADQGYVDEDSDIMGKFFGKKKSSPKAAPKSAPVEEVKQKKITWPWEK